MKFKVGDIIKVCDRPDTNFEAQIGQVTKTRYEEKTPHGAILNDACWVKFKNGSGFLFTNEIELASNTETLKWRLTQ